MDTLSHYHTAGNPGRNNLDETQEIYYPAVIAAIRDTGLRWIRRTRIYSRGGSCGSAEERAAGLYDLEELLGSLRRAHDVGSLVLIVHLVC